MRLPEAGEAGHVPGVWRHLPWQVGQRFHFSELHSVARVRLACPLHPSSCYLQDLSACAACEQGELARLAELPLPAAVQETLAWPRRNSFLSTSLS